MTFLQKPDGILGEENDTVTVSDKHVGVTEYPGKCSKEFGVIVCLVDIHFQQNEACMQAFVQRRMLIQKTIQCMLNSIHPHINVIRIDHVACPRIYLNSRGT